MTILATDIAAEIADRLKIRDDVATAYIDEDDPTLVLVTTQGGKPFLIYVEEAAQPADLGTDVP